MSVTLKNIAVIYTIIFIMVIRNVATRPGGNAEWGDPNVLNRCEADEMHVIEVCQRCAKQTKSPIVYPMCCENEDDVYNWCDKYINYGKKA